MKRGGFITYFLFSLPLVENRSSAARNHSLPPLKAFSTMIFTHRSSNSSRLMAAE